MRLFFAINFDDKVKNSIYNVIEELKNTSLQGNFTHRENIHLTVIFIGETGNIESVKKTLDNISANPFNITLSGLGIFRRDGGDIYWIGVEQNEKLTDIYNQLFKELTHEGFFIEKRDYKPHLTLARKVIIDKSFNKNEFSRKIPHMVMEVNKISLMKSETVNGRLTYTEIYKRELD